MPGHVGGPAVDPRSCRGRLEHAGSPSRQPPDDPPRARRRIRRWRATDPRSGSPPSRPSGSTTTVPGPLSRTTRQGARRPTRTRRPCGRNRPADRRADRVFGRVGGQDRRHARAARARNGATSPSRAFQPIGVEDERKRRLGHDALDRGPGRGPASEARSEHEHPEALQRPQHGDRSIGAEGAVGRGGKRAGDDFAPRCTHAASPGMPHHTIPAPTRIAAWLTIIGAPVIPLDPPTTKTPPDAHKWSAGGVFVVGGSAG